jgi:serine-threonine kinase receptor-associated protein
VPQAVGEARSSRAEDQHDIADPSSTMATESTKVVPLTCHGHSRPVTHLSFSTVDQANDDQYYMVSACKDNNPMLRDGVTGDWIGTFIGHKGACWQARLSSDATIAATGSADFSARVWDTSTGETLHNLPHSHIVRAIAFPPQPRPQILATGGAEKKLRIFDLSRGGTANGSSGEASPETQTTEASAGSPAPSYEIGAGIHQGTIKSIVWTPDSHVLITAADDKKLRWWDLRAQDPIGEYTLDGMVGSCELDSIALKESSGQGTLSVAAGKNVYFFEAERPASLLKHVKTPFEIASVALNGTQRKFVTGQSGDTWVRVWDYDQETELGEKSFCYSLSKLRQR